MNQAREREAYFAPSLFEDLLPAQLVHWQLKALMTHEHLRRIAWSNVPVQAALAVSNSTFRAVTTFIYL